MFLSIAKANPIVVDVVSFDEGKNPDELLRIAACLEEHFPHSMAKAIAKKVSVDEYFSEVLPEDKANFVAREKAAGRKVIMIGDGINDSPALSSMCWKDIMRTNLFLERIFILSLFAL